MDWLKRTFLGPPPNPPAPSPRKEPQPPQVHLDKTEQVLRLAAPLAKNAYGQYLQHLVRDGREA